MYRDLVNLNLNFRPLPGVVTTLFTVTGSNLAWTEATQIDQDILLKENPHMGSWFNRNIPYRVSGLLRTLKDILYPAPRQYAVYTVTGTERVTFPIMNPTCRWGKKRTSAES